MTTKLAHFTRMACRHLSGRHESVGRSEGGQALGVDGALTSVALFHRGRLKLGAGWCNTPSPVLRGAGNEASYGRDSVAPPGNQAATENTNFGLSDDKNPAYSPYRIALT